MNILVADKLSDQAIHDLQALGCIVGVQPDLSADDLPGVIEPYEVLVVRSTKVTAATIEAANNLSLIIRAGAGVNTIDLEKASSRGIYVANCPGKNCDAVAELAIGLLIAADRGIVDASNALRNGKWQKKKFGKAAGLTGRTFGVLGLGQIGLATAKRAQGLGMNVIAWSRSLTQQRADELGIGFAKSPEIVAEQADAISLHLALSPETKHMINQAFLDNMKPGAILINCSRGDVVDTAALIEAVENKGIKAGVDVYENEPTGGEAEFKQIDFAKLVACTPHIGASTEQAAEAIAGEVVRIVGAYIKEGTAPNVVNVRQPAVECQTMIVRHFNRVGVLASVLDELREQKINVEEVRNTIFTGKAAACCTLLLDGMPSDETIKKLSGNPDIIELAVK